MIEYFFYYKLVNWQKSINKFVNALFNELSAFFTVYIASKSKFYMLVITFTIISLSFSYNVLKIFF